MNIHLSIASESVLTANRYESAEPPGSAVSVTSTWVYDTMTPDVSNSGFSRYCNSASASTPPSSKAYCHIHTQPTTH